VNAALTQLELEGRTAKRDLLLVNTFASLVRSGALRDELTACGDF
jgi:hypothetical protein